MKKWKIKETSNDEIMLLLNEYANSLSESTSNVLNGYVNVEIKNNKISYIFRAKNKYETIDVKLFEIKTIDIKGTLKLTIKYYDDSDVINLHKNNLEHKLDSVIQSDKMSNYIGYLINCSNVKINNN